MAKATQVTEVQNPIVTEAVDIAKQLEFDKAALGERIDANRKLLRLLDGNEMLDSDTGAWLDDFYPVRQKGGTTDPEQVKRTTAVRKAAREEIEAVALGVEAEAEAEAVEAVEAS